MLIVVLYFPSPHNEGKDNVLKIDGKTIKFSKEEDKRILIKAKEMGAKTETW
jgi:hypothetical protein